MGGGEHSLLILKLLLLKVWEGRYFEDMFTKDELPNHQVNDNGVCGTAQPTPCLYVLKFKS